MAKLTYGQVYSLARAAGLDHQKAIIATAIAGGESGLDPDAVGDTGITTATWGPSVGLWQVRTLKAETGTGRSRDINSLKDPIANARAMFQISDGGRNWGPWSVYTSGNYRSHLAAATAAAGGANATNQTGPTPSPTFPVNQAAVTVAQGNSPFDVDVNLGPLSGPVEGLIKAAGPILLGSLVVAGGVALVVVGLFKAAK